MTVEVIDPMRDETTPDHRDDENVWMRSGNGRGWGAVREGSGEVGDGVEFAGAA